MKEFQHRLATEGPGIPDVVLDEGLVSLDQFIEEFDEKTAMKDELTVAEKLFNLPVTSYRNWMRFRKSSKFRRRSTPFTARTSTPSSSWASRCSRSWTSESSSRSPTTSKGRIKDMSEVKELADAPVFAKVAETIEGFKDSLPLIENLKSDALRDRH